MESLWIIFAFLGGLALGSALSWLWFRSITEVGIATYKTRLEAAEQREFEQRKIFEHAESRLSDAFKSLAADALSKNNEGFLTLAEQKFKALKGEASQDLEARQKAITGLLGPLKETLKEYQEETKGLEKKRALTIGTLEEQLRALSEAQMLLRREAANLVNALKKPQTRGRWGEITLKRTCELAGMSSHCDFSEQVSVTREDGRLRPDMIINLPADRQVVVDSKVPLDAYLNALESTTDEEREKYLGIHCAQLQKHVHALGSKEYWQDFQGSADFVVLFIPNDSFLSAAVDKSPNLIESALSRKVVISTPTTLIALLKAIAYGWKEEQIAEGAKEISKIGAELYDRLVTLAEHLNKVGYSLGKAVDSYNKATASFESRALASARRFKDLGIKGKKDMPELEPVDKNVRGLLEQAS